jgi:hypothetical protein
MLRGIALKIFVGWLLNARRALDQQDIRHGTITAQNAHKAKRFSVIDRHGPTKIERATARSMDGRRHGAHAGYD